MKTLALIFAGCAVSGACQTGPPQDAKALARDAIARTRALKSYPTQFQARIDAPQGDPIQYSGTTVWVSPGVLYIHYTASGGDEKNIVRAGDNVWVWFSAAGEWLTSDELGMAGAARGIQNPDEVLAVLQNHLGGARLVDPKTVELDFTGEDIEKIMKEQAKKGSFDWKESRAAVRLELDDSARLKKFSCEAALKSTDPNVSGLVKYRAGVELVSVNGPTEMKFFEEEIKDKKKVQTEIPLSETIRKAVAEALKEKK